MVNLDRIIQTGVTVATTVIVVVVIVRAHLGERRDRKLSESEAKQDEICPHCGQNIRVGDSAYGAPSKVPLTSDSDKVIRPAAWSVQDDRKISPLSGWRSGLSALKRAVGNDRDKNE